MISLRLAILSVVKLIKQAIIYFLSQGLAFKLAKYSSN